MSTTKVIIKEGDKPPKKVIDEVREASKRPIRFDDESPEFTKEELRMMAEKARARKENSKKPVVAIRISPDTLDMAKATGKGYTGFISRLLDLAIKDPDMVRRALE